MQINIVEKLVRADGVEMSIPMYLAVLGLCAEFARDEPTGQVLRVCTRLCVCVRACVHVCVCVCVCV